jgi:addiction module HigA family antidote
MTTEMHDPAHPGTVLRDHLEGMNLARFAKHIGVSRVTLSRVLNCHGGVTAEMSLRLSAALGTRPSFWFEMQTNYDFFQAKQKKLPKIPLFSKAA